MTWAKIISKAAEYLSSKGWTAQFIGGLCLMLLTPALGYVMSGKKAAVIGAALGLTVIIWIVAFYILRSIEPDVAPAGSSVEKKIVDKKEDKPISIGNVSGDVVISQNQSGGITAHSVNINETVPPDWSIDPSEKISDSEWRTKLSARGKGRLPYYNWNLLLTLNTEVIRREDVPGEVTVGPWMPLSVRGGSLQPNHFFIGFSEFKPGQALSIYLYSREPLQVLRIDTLPGG